MSRSVPGRGPNRVLAAVLVLPMTTTALTAPQAVAQEYSLDEWMTVTGVNSFEWSPDGRSFYLTREGASGTTEIFRVDAGGGEPVQLSKNRPGVRPEAKSGLAVSPDGRTLYYTSARYFQSYDNIWRMAASGGPAQPLTFNDAVIETAPAPSPDGGTLAYFARTGHGAKIYLIDLRGESRRWPRYLEPDGGQEMSPAWSPDGRYLSFTRGGDIWVKDLSTRAEPRRVIEAPHGGGNGGAVWSPDGTRIAFTKSLSGYAQVGVVEVASGRVTPITYEENEHADVSWSPDGRRLVFVRNDDVGMSRDVVVAAADGSGEVRALTRGKGMRSAPKFSPDGRAIAWIETTTTRARDIGQVPAEGGTPVQVTNSMGAIDPDRLAVAEEVFYPGPDNLPIPALLYKPPNLDPSRAYPVIVKIHGHPGQWNHSFQRMWQYFVDRGFIVIAPNPRGSRDFGQGFHDLHIGDYGGVEFEDVMGVLPFLEGLGYVDMSRKATWGGSGGGYLSLVIATEAPGVFEAQIVDYPVSDWKLLAIDRYGASGIAWTATRTPRRERSEFGGAYSEIPEEYDRRSPINYVENVATPMMMNMGQRDSSTPPRQAQVWYDRMVQLGKEGLIEYHEYPDETHGLSRYSATVRDRLERAERFFAEHLRMPQLAEGG